MFFSAHGFHEWSQKVSNHTFIIFEPVPHSLELNIYKTENNGVYPMTYLGSFAMVLKNQPMTHCTNLFHQSRIIWVSTSSPFQKVVSSNIQMHPLYLKMYINIYIIIYVYPLHILMIKCTPNCSSPYPHLTFSMLSLPHPPQGSTLWPAFCRLADSRHTTPPGVATVPPGCKCMTPWR